MYMWFFLQVDGNEKLGWAKRRQQLNNTFKFKITLNHHNVIQNLNYYVLPDPPPLIFHYHLPLRDMDQPAFESASLALPKIVAVPAAALAPISAFTSCNF
jgi:hypothetical protein